MAQLIKSSNKVVPVLSQVHIAIEWTGDMQKPYLLISLPSNGISAITNIFYDIRQQKKQHYNSKSSIMFKKDYQHSFVNSTS